jgi:hypothetical protein
MRRRIRPLDSRVLLGAVALVAVSATSSAQPVASSLDELKGLAIATSTVKVTDSTGQEVKGRLIGVSSSELTLRTGDATRTFESSQVRTVRLRKEDSLVNGALIGAAVGGGLSSLIFLDNECRNDPDCYTYVAVNAAIGTFVGIGIDALLHGYRVVYAAPTPMARAIAVRPFVTPAAKGVRVTMTF